MERAYIDRDASCPTIIAYRGSSVSETKKAWKSATLRAGIPELHIHDLRPTAMRNMVRAGIGEKVAMQISGHKTRSTFDHYDISDERDIRAAGKKMETYQAERRKAAAAAEEERKSLAKLLESPERK